MGNASTPSGSLSRQIRVLSVKLKPILRNLEQRYSIDPSDSADVAQEALLAFTLHRTEIRHPLSWLVRLVRHGFAKILSARKRGDVSLDALDTERLAALAVDPSASPDDHVRLEAVVSTLSPRHRRVLWMRFVAGMNWREIARALGCQTTSAKKAVFRALEAARRSARLLMSAESYGESETSAQDTAP
ncbi:MAG: sigma-70 family RNA polymerase sigma factor [Thermoanaerobaculia bacterium]